jgi:hypothetical protein
MKRSRDFLMFAAVGSYWTIQGSMADAIPAGEPGHHSHVKPFFEAYCIQCHGPATDEFRA